MLDLAIPEPSCHAGRTAGTVFLVLGSSLMPTCHGAVHYSIAASTSKGRRGTSSDGIDRRHQLSFDRGRYVLQEGQGRNDERRLIPRVLVEVNRPRRWSWHISPSG